MASLGSIIASLVASVGPKPSSHASPPLPPQSDTPIPHDEPATKTTSCPRGGFAPKAAPQFDGLHCFETIIIH